jgi:hypothetical protein
VFDSVNADIAELREQGLPVRDLVVGPEWHVFLDVVASGPVREVGWAPHPVPIPAVAEWTVEGEDYRVRVTLDATAPDRLEVTSVTVTGEKEPVTSTTLRTVRLAEFTQATIRYLANQGYARQWLGSSQRAESVPAVPVTLPSLIATSKGLKLPVEWVAHLRELGPSDPEVARSVASLVGKASEMRQPPVRFITELTDLPTSTVSHWVQVARRLGYLPPSARKRRASAKTSDAATHGDD